MDYVHKPSGRFVVVILALVGIGLVLWAITSFIFNKSSQSKDGAVGKGKNSLITVEDQLRRLDELSSQAVPMTGAEEAQALKRLSQMDTSRQPANKTKKKSQVTTSPPLKVLTVEEQIKTLDRLSQQH